MQTDWNSYHSKPAKAASVTRQITLRKIIRCCRAYTGDLKAASILELGGGNSCFYRGITKELAPAKFILLDNNRQGLEQFRASNPEARNVELIESDALQWRGPPGKRADIVYSAGLIEHFDREGTRKCIEAHFRAVRQGGLVLITFPTPTWLYRLTRKMIELVGLWIFHDERPLELAEVEGEMRKYGKVLHKSITWPICLTQGTILVQVEKPL